LPPLNIIWSEDSIKAEFVVAVRFAWLSEWLRHKDSEMIELETIYMNLFVDNSGMLKSTWKI
jgi:homoserine kinase type II